jgi:hypothetical protein
MAQGDLTVFDEAKLALLNGTHDLDTHVIKCAILDNTTAPTAGTATPTLGDFTQVGAAGSYTTGGTTLTISLTEAAGTVTFDSTTNPSWAQNASNDTDAYWGLIYNDTAASDDAIAFIDLGGPVDMTAGDLTITFNASGIFTLQ